MIQSVLLACAFVVGTVALSLLFHFIARRAVGPEPNQATKELAASMVLRVSALHVLIVALVFAQEMTDYQNIRKVSAVEAAAIADVYNDARRYGDGDGPKIQADTLAYLKRVISPEWDNLGGAGRLDALAWKHWEAAYEAAIALVPANERQATLRQHMIDRLRVIAEQRGQRENEATNLVDQLFWFAAIAGQIFVSMALYTYSPSRHNVFLFSIYGAFVGIILFFIYSFSDPYAQPGEMSPAPFQRLLDDITKGA